MSVFAVVPFGLLLADRSRVDAKTLETAYAVCLGVAWPILLIGAAPLGVFWHKDRKVDRDYCSTLSPGQLLVVLLGMLAIGVGGLMLLAAQVIELVAVLKEGIEWIAAINITAILLVIWIVLLVVQAALEAQEARRGVVDLRASPAPTEDAKPDSIEQPSEQPSVQGPEGHGGDLAMVEAPLQGGWEE